jgi:hypothetical protein
MREKFDMPFLILAILHGISNRLAKYEFQILSNTWDIALRNLKSLGFCCDDSKIDSIIEDLMFKTELDMAKTRHRLFVFRMNFKSKW